MQKLTLFLPGMFLYLEVQRDRLPMREQQYSKELGGTAGCTMCLIEALRYSGQLESQENGRRMLVTHGLLQDVHVVTAKKSLGINSLEL